MKTKYVSCLLLLFVFFAGKALAGDKLVTVADGSNVNTVGSLPYELMHLEDGDVLRFDPSLANQTIDVKAAAFVPNGDNGTKNVTIIGNGVTITSSNKKYLDFGTSTTKKFASIRMENIYLKDYEITFHATKTEISNCTFISPSGSGRTTRIASSDNILFKGCAFIGENNNAANCLFVESVNTVASGMKASFVSCTFVRNYAGNKPLVKFNATNVVQASFTNCVFIDPNNTGTNYTITVPEEKLNFAGYNVIQGSVNGNWTATASNHATDIVVDKTAPSPLYLEDGIYKVEAVINNGVGPAYEHLPANTVIADVSFPRYDLAGTEIDYTQATHSGAWQVTHGTPMSVVYPESVSIGGATDGQEILCNVLNEDKTLHLTASVIPNGAVQGVTWTSSDETVATIDPNTGDVIISFIETPETSKTVTFTATSTALKADGQPVTGSITITVKPFVHVERVEFATNSVRDIIHTRHKLSFSLEPAFYPSDATNKSYTWAIEDPSGVVEVYTDNAGGEINRSIIGKKAGTVKVKLVTDDGGLNSEEATFTFREPFYSGVNGAFLLTEGNYPASGKINFLNEPSGEWDHYIYSTVNNYDINGRVARDLGITTPTGVIYGDNFFFVSKQEPRLVVADPLTLVERKEFHNVFTEDNRFTSLDGRSFLGVDENTGYLGTAGGICVVHFDELLSTPGNMSQGGTLVDEAVNELPYTLIRGTHTGVGQYSGQVGTMRRVGDRVFAVQQNSGLLVINALTHTLEAVIDTYYFSVLAQSLDGTLWAGATTIPYTGGWGGNSQEEDLDEPAHPVLLRINPYNLEITEVPLPSGVPGPRVSWGAWQADAFMGSAQKNQLYWAGDRKTIIRYDIATGTAETVFNSANYAPPAEFPAANWSMYGTSFGVHPVTDELYVWITLFHLQAPNAERAVWEIHKLNLEDNTDITYPIRREYWWPSMWIWLDESGPEISNQLNSLALSAEKKISLREMVTDYDSMDAAIVKSIVPGYDASLIDVQIKRDSLFITPLTVPAFGSPRNTTLTLKANSNGKVTTKDIQISVQGEDPGTKPVTGVSLDYPALQLTVGQSWQLYETVDPYDADDTSVYWTSDNSAVASVSAGWIVAHAAGTAEITVTTNDGGWTASCWITVEPAAPNPKPVTGVSLDRASAQLTVGQTLELHATVNPSDADNPAVRWETSDSGLASVDNSGRVTALAPGTPTITVTTLDGGFTATCSLTIESSTGPEVNPFELTADKVTIRPGAQFQLNLTAPEHYPNIRWSTSHPEVATVTTDGLVEGIAHGIANIIARDANGTKADTCMVTVMAAAAPRDTIALSTTQLVMNVDETAKLSVVLVSENLKDQPVVWTTSDPLVAEMEVDGTVVARGAGVAILTASVGEVRATCAVAVRDVAVTASTTSVEENTAAISFPKMASASYYLVHVYEMVNQQRERLISLKVTLEGGIVIAYAPQRAPAANEIGLNLSYLKSDTPYEVDIEVVRERDNRTEVISTLPLAFRTAKGNVGIDMPSPDAAQAVWRADVLYVENLAGFTCRLIASNGQPVKRFEVNASREWHSMPLPAGLYLLYVEKGDVRKTFKLMVRR